MKIVTKIKNFCKRLYLAWQIANDNKCYYMGFADNNVSDEHVFLTAAMDAAEEYLNIKTDDPASLVARRNIIRHALITEGSILAQYKEDDNCCVSYDCNSEEDLKELLNQKI